MSLFGAALLVSFIILVGCTLPFWLMPARTYARVFLFAGTAVLLGFVFADLIPEMWEMGGVKSLLLTIASWLVFSGFHALKRKGHKHHTHHGCLHERQAGRPSHGIYFLLGSLGLHCFAGGVLLVTSYAVSERLATAVLLSLLGHKAFEAISVGSVLLESSSSPRHLARCAIFYIISFPLGVLLAEMALLFFAEYLSVETLQLVAMIVTSIAVGSLLGCLVQDFLIPGLSTVRFLKRSSMPNNS